VTHAESEIPARAAAARNSAMWDSATRTRRCDSLRAAAGFRRLMRSVMGANVFRPCSERKRGIAARMSYRCITVDPMETPTSSDVREERGRQLARMGTIRKTGRRWVVPSQTRPAERYLVDVEDAACTCPDYALRRGTCKHQHAVLFWIAWGCDVDADGNVTETITVKRKTYRQKDWGAYNASQHHEKEYVERLLRALCAGVAQPPRRPGRGRPPRLVSDLVFSAVMKVYVMLSGRRMRSDLEASAAKGHLQHVGHENCVFNFLADPATTAILTSLVEQSAAPLQVIEAGQYAIDSTGFSTAVYDRWFSQKHGKLCSQNAWVKLHVACGTVTHAVTSAVVTPQSDDSQLPALLARTRAHHDVRELSADKAYSTHANHDVLETFGVAAYIPFKDNAVVNPKSPAWSRHLCEFLLNQERFLPHYHRRSNVETTFAMIKAKFGAAVRARVPIAQVNEVLAKCVAHNLCCVVKAIFTAGLAPTFWPDATARSES
jgi:transposase